MAREPTRGRSIALLLGGLALLSCRKPDYFPLRDNLDLRFAAAGYEVVGSDSVRTESLTYAIAVAGSTTQPGLGRVWEIRVTRNAEPYLSLFLRKTTNAVFVLPRAQPDEIEPSSDWLKLIELPPREGALWYGDAERSVSFEVLQRTDVETAAGRARNCFRIRIHADEPYLTDFWLAPDVGVIRWTRRLSASRFEVAERVRR
ncbi:MAG TPA: hypothetical protein VMH22_00510 [bacterium]|nr:hypothetical protein [bacterium]